MRHCSKVVRNEVIKKKIKKEERIWKQWLDSRDEKGKLIPNSYQTRMAVSCGGKMGSEKGSQLLGKVDIVFDLLSFE